MSNPFEVVGRWKDKDINLPQRKTSLSAGYDIECAADTLIPSYSRLMAKVGYIPGHLTLDEIAKITKASGIKPTLVPTGLKCRLEPTDYLQLCVRSSAPLKYWLMLANGIGVIDADYYNNRENEGEIYFQLINLFSADILIKKGETIGQGIILPYKSYETVNKTREGGFGSSDNLSS